MHRYAHIIIPLVLWWLDLVLKWIYILLLISHHSANQFSSPPTWQEYSGISNESHLPISKFQSIFRLSIGNKLLIVLPSPHFLHFLYPQSKNILKIYRSQDNSIKSANHFLNVYYSKFFTNGRTESYSSSPAVSFRIKSTGFCWTTIFVVY